MLVGEDVPGMFELVSENFDTDQICSRFNAINGYLLSHKLGFDFYNIMESRVTPGRAEFLRSILCSIRSGRNFGADGSLVLAPARDYNCRL